jgi:hypothetical protein
MPQTAAILTALILDRPMCSECIAMRTPLRGAEQVQKALTELGQVLKVHRERSDRCRACGEHRPVFSVERPSV